MVVKREKNDLLDAKKQNFPAVNYVITQWIRENP